jgi:hypothetical protein
MTKRNRPSFGRTKAERGLDQFDTPPIALKTLFMHEPLLADITSVCEPFSGRGNLVVLMRLYGLTVYASDIEDRGCPGSDILDFLDMTVPPADCYTLISNPAYGRAMDYLEHAWRLGFRLVIFLLPPSFLHSADRFERMHARGHLRRYYPIAERLQGMHDAKHVAAGGKLASQPQIHAWCVFDQDYCGKPEIIPVSIDNPTVRMPWAARDVASTAEAAE